MTQWATTSMNRLLSWARSNSLWYLQVGDGCCANEILNTEGCRYDLERFGCLPQVDPRQADLLFVSGVITKKSAPEIMSVYQAMRAPKYVMAVGACACSGGLFGEEPSKNGIAENVLGGAEKLLPIDVFVPGCPPRPESIMRGLIILQEKINGKERARPEA